MAAAHWVSARADFPDSAEVVPCVMPQWHYIEAEHSAPVAVDTRLELPHKEPAGIGPHSVPVELRHNIPRRRSAGTGSDSATLVQVHFAEHKPRTSPWLSF